MEDEQHKIREKEHGKNYLLETYLKGLHDADEKQESATGNSDSGVHTEETTTTASPEVTHPQNEDEISETLLPTEQNLSKASKKKRSKRESELLMEHESTKEFSNTITEEKSSETNNGNEPLNDEVAAQIDILEKLIVLNKHLQREEELMVRLGAKIKRYEADASGLTEQQVKDSLDRVNDQLNNNSHELQQMETEIKVSEDILCKKTDVLKKLYDELEEAEVEHRRLNCVGQPPDVIPDLSLLLPHALTLDKHHPHEENLNLSREYLAENIYNISKIILKSNAPGPSNINGNLSDFIRHTPDPLSNDVQIPSQQLYPPPVPFQNKKVIQAQIHTIPQQSQQSPQIYISKQPKPSQIPNLEQYQLPNLEQTTPSSTFNHLLNESVNKTSSTYNDVVQASMSYLEKINQRIQKNNDNSINNINNSNNMIMQATNIKLGPKKMINQHVISSVNSSNIANTVNIQPYMLQPPQIKIDGDSNSDTGLSSLGDVSQLGTLV